MPTSDLRPTHRGATRLRRRRRLERELAADLAVLVRAGLISAVGGSAHDDSLRFAVTEHGARRPIGANARSGTAEEHAACALSARPPVGEH